MQPAASSLASLPRPLKADWRLWVGVVGATSLSVLLHLGLLGLPQSRPAGAERGIAPAHLAAIVRVQPAATVPRNEPAPASSASEQALEKVLADPDAPIDIQPSAGALAPAQGAHDMHAPAPQAYLMSEFVDQPAAPLSDWLVPRDETTAGRVFEFTARVFISRKGEIDRIELVEPATPTPSLEAVLAEMQRTRMQPARLQGRDVASQRTIGFRIEVERAEL